MLRRLLVSVLALCLAPLVLSFSSAAGGSVLPTGNYIVVLKDGAAVPAVASAATGLGGTVDGLFGAVDTLVASLTTSQLSSLRHDRRVAYVARNRPVHLLDSSSASSVPAVPTGVERIGAAPAVNRDGSVAGGTGTAAAPAKKAAVALLDTGVMTRSDLNVVGGYDCAPSTGGGLLGILGGRAQTAADGDAGGIPADDNGHGTHVAGIVADKGIPGVIGVSPGTPLYAVRVFGADGSGDISNVICGLNWVAQNAAADNIKVVNMSLGGEGTSDADCGSTDQDPFHTAVCRVTAAGVTVVAAAGNDGGDLARSTPAAYPEVLAVTSMSDFDGQPGGLASTADCSDGAQEQDDTASSFSDYAVPGSADAGHTIAAPGLCITSTWNDGGIATISGTSMASPHVAGLVARCIDAGPCAGLTPAQIIAKLRSDAAARPAAQGFVGDTHTPIPGKYYGDLADDIGY
jgi:subtilisin family serine protease